MNDALLQYNEIALGASEIIQADELQRLLEKSVATATPLIVKEGFDPTAPDIHLGHMVTIRKLQTFQKFGHRVVFLIGDYTGLVGDPSGRNTSRKQMSEEEVMANAETYKKQIFKVLDPEKTEIRFNSAWFKKLDFAGVLELTSRYTVARLLERDDFAKRFKAGNPISVMEFIYPLMQGYDSVALHADIEIGGTDQKFNLLVGRSLQERYGQKPQVVMTFPLLLGTDGKEKMSKSLGNYIGINEPPEQIYGKTMSIPDNLIYDYFLLASNVGQSRLAEIKKALDSGSVNPMTLKKELAFNLVEIYHSSAEAERAARDFELKFSKRDIPENIPILEINSAERDIWLPRAIVISGVAASSSAAIRLIEGGGVELNGARVEDKNYRINLAEDNILKIGKKNFFRLRWVK